MAWAAVPLLVASLGATAQVQNPGLPTENPALPPGGARPGGDDCNRQAQAIRDQFRIQENNVRREIAERSRLATGAEKDRIRQEGQQRLASLRLEAVEAERRVMTSCRG